MGKNLPLPSKNLCQLNCRVLISCVSQCPPPHCSCPGKPPSSGAEQALYSIGMPAQARALLQSTANGSCRDPLPLGKYIQAKSNFKKHMFNLNSYLYPFKYPSGHFCKPEAWTPATFISLFHPSCSSSEFISMVNFPFHNISTVEALAFLLQAVII